MSDIRHGDGVTSVELDDVVYVARLPDGPMVVLEGTGALIWRELSVDADLTTLSRRVAASLLDPPADLIDQIAVFLGVLRKRGLLDG